jgi:hypothetical protein
MAVISRILEMFDTGTSARKIAERLSLEGIAAPQGGPWYGGTVRYILDRHQRPSGRRRTGKRIPRVWDRERATALALACRRDGLSLRAIAKKLDAAKLAPPRGGKWHASTVLLLLGPLSAADAVDDRTRAQQLRAEGKTLREIGRMLLAEGYRPPHAAQWHTQAVSAMLAATS